MLKNNFFKPGILLLALFLVLPLAACRQAHLSNFFDLPVTGVRSGSLTKEQVKSVILAACKARGWAAGETEPGLISATFTSRVHTAQIEIPYTSAKYSIIYKNSNNLKYNAQKQTIHKWYNKWVSDLRREIDDGLARK